MSIVVYKLGGSLLDLPDWADRLRELWRAAPSTEVRLLVVGGGRAADLVRDWDREFSLGEIVSHEIALTALRLTEHLAAALLPECSSIRTLDDALHLPEGSCGLVSAGSFLDHLPEGSGPIPKHWDFTTDSIAACIAQAVGAERLVLLKSSTPETETDVRALTEEGFVDREFARWSNRIPCVEIVNLREVCEPNTRGSELTRIAPRELDTA